MTSGFHTSAKESKASTPAAYAQFVESMPDVYDIDLGPFLFEFSARDLAQRLKLAAPPGIKNVLETACGTGISTEHLANAFGPDVAITATDLNQTMLDIAAKRRGQLENVTYRQADALQLPFDDASYDAVACQFGIMFFPDKRQALKEIVRVLRPGGLFAFNVWDSLANNRVVELAHETITSFFPNDPPDFLETPFGYYETDPIKTLLEEEGFSNIGVHIVSETMRYESAESPARGLIVGNPVIVQIVERASVDPREIMAALAKSIEAEFGPPPFDIPRQEIAFIAQKS